MTAGIGLYIKNSASAVELYCRAFGLTLGYNVKNPDGSYYHSELYSGKDEVLSVVESGGKDLKDNIIQVGMTLDTEEKVKKAFNLLLDGGTVNIPLGPLPWSPCAGSLWDRFGVWWYISAPQHRPDESFDPTKPLEEQL